MKKTSPLLVGELDVVLDYDVEAEGAAVGAFAVEGDAVSVEGVCGVEGRVYCF